MSLDISSINPGGGRARGNDVHLHSKYGLKSVRKLCVQIQRWRFELDEQIHVAVLVMLLARHTSKQRHTLNPVPLRILLLEGAEFFDYLVAGGDLWFCQVSYLCKDTKRLVVFYL